MRRFWSDRAALTHRAVCKRDPVETRLAGNLVERFGSLRAARETSQSRGQKLGEESILFVEALVSYFIHQFFQSGSVILLLKDQRKIELKVKKYIISVV